MKADLFLKLNGVKGESIDAKHSGEIELESAHWGISVAVSSATGVLGSAGKADIKALSVTKRIDRSSPTIHSQACIGQIYDSMVLTKRKSGDTPLEYLKITFKEVVVSNIDISINGSGTEMDMEVVTFTFAEFREEYKPQNSDGSGAACVEAGFNCVTNVKY